MSSALLGHLTRSREARLALAPGESFRAVVDRSLRGREFSVRLPDGTRRAGGRVEPEGEEDVIRFGDTQAVGGYEIFAGSDERPIARLRRATGPGGVRPSARSMPLNSPRSPRLRKRAKSDAAPRLVVTREFWPLIIAIVAALAVVEMALAFRFSRAR